MNKILQTQQHISRRSPKIFQDIGKMPINANESLTFAELIYGAIENHINIQRTID